MLSLSYSGEDIVICNKHEKVNNKNFRKNNNDVTKSNSNGLHFCCDVQIYTLTPIIMIHYMYPARYILTCFSISTYYQLFQITES